MVFFQPLFLYFLPLISLPIIIHLFARRQKTIVPFSTLRFLKLLENTRIRRLRLRQWLLLLLRTLALLFLILTFARPVLRGTAGIFGAESQTAAALVIDVSLSTQARSNQGTVFDRIHSIADAILSVNKPNDQFILIPSGGNADWEAYSLPTAGAGTRLKDMTAGFHRGNLVSGLQAAHRALDRITALNKEIYVLTDLQRTEWLVPDTVTDARGYWTAVLAPPAEAVSNTGIDRLILKNQILEQGKEIEMAATVVNYTDQDQTDRLAGLYVNDERAAQTQFNLPTQTGRELTFRMIPSSTGPVAAFVEIDEDHLTADNKRYTTFRIPEQIRILTITGHPSPLDYLHMALTASPGTDAGFSVARMTPTEALKSDWAEFDVLIFNQWLGLSPGHMERLHNHLQRGRGAIFIPPAAFDYNRYNAEIAAPLGVPRFGAPLGSPGQSTAYLAVRELQVSHPVFQGLFVQDQQPTGMPHVFYNYALQPTSRDLPLIELSNRQPFLMERLMEPGRVMVFASGLDLEWSDFPLKGLFAPLIHRLVQYLVSMTSTPSGLIGEPVSLTTRRNAGSFEVRDPGNNLYRLPIEITQDRYGGTFSMTYLPGIYTFLVDGIPETYFAVNCDPNESDLTRISPEELEERLPGSELFLVNDRRELQQWIARRRYGKELNFYFLAAALLCLLAEMAFARTKQSDLPEPSREEFISV